MYPIFFFLRNLQDKSLTYTYCRFELSQYINNIFIVDFDEFPYCPSTKLSIEEQSKAIYSLINSYALKGTESLLWHRSALPFMDAKKKEALYCIDTSYYFNSSINQAHDTVGGFFACYEGLV